MSSKDIFAIYFPSWHPDKHYEKWYGRGFSEWELLKTTKPLFSGHRQPKKPLWGYFDESTPEWMAKQIDTAADYGITGFLFDWYWYNGEKFLEKALEEGWLNAKNNKKLKFALMWANHDWGRWPALDDDGHSGMNGNANQSSSLFLRAFHSLDDCRKVAAYCCEHYFKFDNYWKIDGNPVFSFFAVDKLTEQLGGSVKVAEALGVMTKTAQEYGFRGIHFLANIGCCNDNTYCCGYGRVPDAKKMGFESVFAYNIVASPAWERIPNENPVFDYSEIISANEYCWEKIEAGPLPHFRSVTLGVDVAPRWNRKIHFPMDFKKFGYCPICINNTPEMVGTLLEKALKGSSDTVIINAWNEWTEGMYLIPEEKYGYAYLEAIKKIQEDVKNE